MRNLIFTAWDRMWQRAENPAGNQNGSVILIALMILVIMTVIGLSASQTSITESYVIRNTSIYNQNVSLLESAAEEIAEDTLINIPDPPSPYLSSNSPLREPYIVSYAQWNDPSLDSGVSANTRWYDINTVDSGRVLTGSATGTATDTYFDGTNGRATINWVYSSNFPQWVQPQCAGSLPLLSNVRGDANNALRVCLVGWKSAKGSSLKSTLPAPKVGFIMAEYDSPNYGIMRMEIGIQRTFN